MITHQAQVEQAFETLLQIHAQAVKVNEDMEQVFGKYSPFHYMPSKIANELRDIRKKLIEQAARELNKAYIPNAKIELDFHKLMNEQLGDTALKLSVIESWFRLQASDKENLRKISYRHIFKLARHFAPYHSQGQPHGPPRDPRELVQGRQLVLRAYTWRSGSSFVPASLSYSLNDKGQYDALEKLIAITTMRADPANVESYWLAKHVVNNRSNPEEFYGKHEIKHPTVKAFQFFKNDKFRIWFYHPQQAQKMAHVLCQTPPEQKELTK